MAAIEYPPGPQNDDTTWPTVPVSLRTWLAGRYVRRQRRRSTTGLYALDRRTLGDIGLSPADRGFAVLFGRLPTNDGRPPVQHL